MTATMTEGEGGKKRDKRGSGFPKIKWYLFGGSL